MEHFSLLQVQLLEKEVVIGENITYMFEQLNKIIRTTIDVLILVLGKKEMKSILVLLQPRT